MFKITLIGRPNVGKSTLFNRLVEEEQAIVSKLPGTTRDRRYGQCWWIGQPITIIDTGGLIPFPKKEQELEKTIVQQIDIALQESDLIIFVIDGRTSLTSVVYQIAKLARSIKNKPIILAINKIDSPKIRQRGISPEIYKLGFKNTQIISAIQGIGVGDLLDKVYQKLKITTLDSEKEKEEIFVKIAFIGFPNVGKSSLLNTILGKQRVIVTAIPHTTREPQDIFIHYQKKLFNLIDTAGIIRRSKINSKIIRSGIEKSLFTIERANLVFLIIDAPQPITRQTKRLLSYAIEKNKGVILVINKQDKVNSKEQKKYLQYCHNELPVLTWIPTIFTSAKNKQGIKQLLNLAITVRQEQTKIISPDLLKKMLLNLAKQESLLKNSRIKQHYLYTDTFSLIIHHKDIPLTYLTNLIKKQIRKDFGFIGIPIQVRINRHRQH